MEFDTSPSYWGGITFEATHNYLGSNCLPCQRRLPSNGSKNSGLYDQFDHARMPIVVL